MNYLISLRERLKSVPMRKFVIIRSAFDNVDNIRLYVLPSVKAFSFTLSLSESASERGWRLACLKRTSGERT